MSFASIGKDIAGVGVRAVAAGGIAYALDEFALQRTYPSNLFGMQMSKPMADAASVALGSAIADLSAGMVLPKIESTLGISTINTIKYGPSVVTGLLHGGYQYLSGEAGSPQEAGKEIAFGAASKLIGDNIAGLITLGSLAL